MRLFNSLLSIVVDSSDYAVFQYADPVLTAIYVQSEAAYPGYTFVTLSGDNFCASETCCETSFNDQRLSVLPSISVPSEGIISHSNTQILIKVLGTGPVSVTCFYTNGSSVTTSAISFSSNSPFILGAQSVSTMIGLESGNGSWSTLGGQYVEIWGLFFGQDQAQVDFFSFSHFVFPPRFRARKSARIMISRLNARTHVHTHTLKTLRFLGWSSSKRCSLEYFQLRCGFVHIAHATPKLVLVCVFFFGRVLQSRCRVPARGRSQFAYCCEPRRVVFQSCAGLGVFFVRLSHCYRLSDS